MAFHRVELVECYVTASCHSYQILWNPMALIPWAPMQTYAMVLILWEPMKLYQAKPKQTYGIILEIMLVILSHPMELHGMNSMESNRNVFNSMVLILCIRILWNYMA